MSNIEDIQVNYVNLEFILFNRTSTNYVHSQFF
jgi:hypothetical protein